MNFMCRRFGTLFYLHRSCGQDTTHKDRTDSVFRNVGTQNSDAGESPKRKTTNIARIIKSRSKEKEPETMQRRYKEM